jgi:glyoxylase-like metal-dependent hydrolase (beta-lactamase superfamily II)
MPYLTQPEPPRGEPQDVLAGIRCLTAANPGPMTYHGTNTYLFEDSDGMVVVDPGPEDPGHVDAIMAATGGEIVRILLTHAHRDHLGALADLKARTGARVASFHASTDPAYAPNIGLVDGDTIGSLTAVHTPGHAMDHICFARADGILFSGDHVMGWCSTVVGPPPLGNMSAYFDSLQRLIDRPDRQYLPGHGPVLPNPQPYVAELLRRRIAREVEIVATIRDGISDPVEITAALYHKAHPTLKRAAERNVRSHLSKLVAEGRISEDGAGRYSAG